MVEKTLASSAVKIAFISLNVMLFFSKEIVFVSHNNLYDVKIRLLLYTYYFKKYEREGSAYLQIVAEMQVLS